jgi:hypothetical protein
MQMILTLFNGMEDRDAIVAINQSSLLLCLSRSLSYGPLSSWSKLLLCIPEFYGHALTVTIRSVSELELDPGGNRLEIYPTPRLIAIEDVLGPSRSKVEETPDGSVRIPFLRIRNNTPERIVICESRAELSILATRGRRSFARLYRSGVRFHYFILRLPLRTTSL